MRWHKLIVCFSLQFQLYLSGCAQLCQAWCWWKLLKRYSERAQRGCLNRNYILQTTGLEKTADIWNLDHAGAVLWFDASSSWFCNFLFRTGHVDFLSVLQNDLAALLLRKNLLLLPQWKIFELKSQVQLCNLNVFPIKLDDDAQRLLGCHLQGQCHWNAPQCLTDKHRDNSWSTAPFARGPSDFSMLFKNLYRRRIFWTMPARWWQCLACRAKYSIPNYSTKNRSQAQKGLPNSRLYGVASPEQTERPQVSTCAKALKTGV